MSTIGPVDQAVLQLRAQLQRLARERSGGTGSAVSGEAPPLARLRDRRPRDGADDGEFRRKFVRALLTEELGESLGNEPEFERISNEVWRLLDEDDGSRRLLDAAIARLETRA